MDGFPDFGCLPGCICFDPAVRGITSFLRYWLPVIVWMLVIFSASSDSMSSGNTSRFIGPLVRWLKPDISEESLGRIVYGVRKSAHVTEYAIFALLLWRAWRNTIQPSPRDGLEQSSVIASSVPPRPNPFPQGEGADCGHQSRGFHAAQTTAPTVSADSLSWHWSQALIVLALAALYAASDEIHQYFVPSREARFGDVLLDTFGAALGLLILWAFGRCRRRW